VQGYQDRTENKDKASQVKSRQGKARGLLP
jgi:hypothetical protein